MEKHPKTTTLKPGMRLVPDWQGKPYVVEVIDQGFIYRGRIFNSLTRIVREITGTHSSGPRFFGVK